MADANQEPLVEAPLPEAPVASSDVTPSTETVVPEVAQADSTTAPEEIPDTAEPSPTEEDAPKRNRAQERIEDLVAERNAAKEYADYWRQEALNIREHARGTQPPQPQAPQDLAPTLQEYKFDQAKWAEAHSSWTDREIKRQVAAAVPQVLEHRSSQDAQVAALQAYTDKIETFKETHSDFDFVVANPKLPALDRTAAAMVVASTHAAELTYTLAKNPDLTTRISRMSPPQQALAIGRLESQVSGDTSVVSKQTTRPQAPAAKAPNSARSSVGTTQAPPPPSPVPTGGVADASPETMSTKDWMKWRNQEARSRRR